jgi:hypothetical protein
MLEKGLSDETIAVRVATRELDRVPPNSWFERLPPLDVPLTSVARGGNQGDLEQLWLELILMLMDYRRFMLVIQIWLMVIMN